jgi:hypothetical protein
MEPSHRCYRPHAQTQTGSQESASACDASGNEIEANASQAQPPIIEPAAGGFSGPLDHATGPLNPLLAVPAAPTAQPEIQHGTLIPNENTLVPSSNAETPVPAASDEDQVDKNGHTAKDRKLLSGFPQDAGV